MNNTTTVRRILAYQAAQLKEWESVLKPEVYLRLEALVKAGTDKIDEGDLDEPFFIGRLQDLYHVPRGADMNNIVGNLMVRVPVP